METYVKSHAINSNCVLIVIYGNKMCPYSIMTSYDTLSR